MTANVPLAKSHVFSQIGLAGGEQVLAALQSRGNPAASGWKSFYRVPAETIETCATVRRVTKICDKTVSVDPCENTVAQASFFDPAP